MENLKSHPAICGLCPHGSYDRAFVENWTSGFDELAAYASEFTPGAAAQVCGVAEGTIEWLAASIAEASGVAIDFYSGLEYAPSGVQNTGPYTVCWRSQAIWM